MKSAFCYLLSSISVAALAGELPEPIIPAGVGVNIHFVTGHQQDLDLISAAGFKFIRMDFGWESTEPKKGEYRWNEYEELLGNLDQRGLRPVFILDYSHHLYEEKVTSPHPFNGAPHETTASPQHPESVAAYARWAAAAAAHFKGRHVIWEIWNEPNIQFWSPKPDARQYTELALAACKSIRESDPQATIIAPASSGFPWEFLETLFQAGILKYLDAVSVHPYRNPSKPPETVSADYARLRQLIGRYKPGDRPSITILSGEWGYSSNTKGVKPETQAAFAVRQQLVNLLEGVPLSIWYDWKNDGADPAENEHNFGTVLPDLKPKPAYDAIKTLTHELAGYRVMKRVESSESQIAEKDYVLSCRNKSGDEKLAAWTIGDSHQITLPAMGTARRHALVASKKNVPELIKGTKGTGEPFSLPVTSSNTVVVQLEAMPQYLDFGAQE